MATVTFETKDVQISSVFFRENPSQMRFESFPRRIVYGGREYALVEK